MKHIFPRKKGGKVIRIANLKFLNRQTDFNFTFIHSFIKAALLQLDFPAFLRQRTRAATPRGEAIAIRVPTNPIAFTSFGTSVNLSGNGGPVGVNRKHLLKHRKTYMQDPSISGDDQRAINEAVIVICFAAAGKRCALLLQMAQALSVLAINHARATGGRAACDGKWQSGSA